MNLLLNYHGRPVADVYDGYQSVVSREFYDGELGLGADPVINASMEKAFDYPFILTRLNARNQISYRRRLSHIRGNRTDFQTAWIIRRGGLRVVRTDGTVLTPAGAGAIYDSTAPFFVELVTDDQGVHDSLIAFIPMHLFRSKVGNFANFNLSFSLASGAGLIADRMLSMMYGHGQSASRRLLETLSDCALAAMAGCIADQVTPALSVSERRIAEIERQIMQHLGDPNLSATSVAQGCNMSIRYLHYILKASGRTLSSLLWNARLDRACETMRSVGAKRQSVHEIAQICGYKSVAHFRRQFRSRYGVSPKQYRERYVEREGAAAER